MRSMRRCRAEVAGSAAQQAYQAAGGQRGTGLGFADFLASWQRQRAELEKKGITANPRAYAESLGLTWGGALQSGKGQRAGAGADVFTPGASFADFTNPTVMTEEGQRKLVAALTGLDPSEKIMRSASTPFQFAGREQFIAPPGDPRRSGALANTSMVGLEDPNSLALFLGNLMAAADPKSKFAEWQKLVPEWAPDVVEELAGRGIPSLPVGLIADPRFNLNDPSRPFLPADARPASLGQLGAQAGEISFLRGLSAPEFFREIAPYIRAIENRPAGSKIPSGLEAGLTFGNPVLGNYNTGLPTNSVTLSPLRGVFGSGVQRFGEGLLGAAGISPEQAAEMGVGPDGLAAYGPWDPRAGQMDRALSGGLYSRFGAHGRPGEPGGTGRLTPDARANGALPPMPLAQALQELNGIYSQKYGKPAYQLTGPEREQYEADKKALILELNAAWSAWNFWRNPLYEPWRNLDQDTASRFNQLYGDPTVPSAELVGGGYPV